LSAGSRPREGGGGLPLEKSLFALAAPLVISFWLRAAFAWVDKIYAAMLGDLADPSLAAIGLTLPFEFLMIACWVGTSNGLTARISAAMGAREGRRVEQLKRATLRIVSVLIVGFLFLAGGIWSFAEKVGLEAAAAHQFRIYAAVLLGGSAFTSFWSILPDSLVKAHQDTRSTMWAGLISASLNVLLNTVFVLVFRWGIFGIAFSTVLGRIGGLLYARHRAGLHERARRAAGRDGNPGVYEKPVRAILTISIPSSINYVLLALEALAINFLLARGPDPTATLAAWSIFDQSVRFMAMPMIAMSVAMLPYAARRWGAGRLDEIRRSLKLGLLAGAGYGILFVVPLAFLLGPSVAHGLSNSPETGRYALIGMHFLPFTFLAMAPMFLMRSTFEGMQQPRPGLTVSFVRSIFLVVPLTFLGTQLAPRWDQPAVLGACLGYSLGAALASALLAAWIRRALNKPGARGGDSSGLI